MKNTFLLLALLSFGLSSLAQDKYTVSGYIRDAATGEDIIGANVYIQETQKGVTSNVYGFYSLTVENPDFTLIISSIGYTTFEKSLTLKESLSLNVELKPFTYQSEEVIIRGEQSKNTEGSQMGREKISIKKIKSLPALLGEVDILKTIQLLPGVQSAGEGNSGFYVRGGGPDQNLILLDNATVYNASHLFGFFSVFNADAVKNIEIIKGGMPAQYGGRVSSVLDITLNEGNNKSFHGTGGIGLISSRLLLEGPIVKNKASFAISARRTYIDILMKPFLKDNSGLGYYFYDLNMKINYRVSDKDRFYMSGYFGQDVFNFASNKSGFQVKIPWGNTTFSTRWNHLFNDKLFMNTIGTFTKYNFAFDFTQGEDNSFKLSSSIKDWGLKSQINYFPNIRHNAKAGVELIFHEFVPSSITATSGDVEFDLGGEVHIFSREYAAFIQDDFDITEKLRLHTGFRMTGFQHIGPYTKYIISQNQGTLVPPAPPEIIEYDKGKVLKSYWKPEPRINMRFKTGTNSSIKAAYTHNYQFLHLTSMSPTSMPTDIWIPSTDVVEPQFGEQYAVGFFKNFFSDTLETSVELYYKNLDNLIEFIPGTTPENNVNNNIDNNLTFGTGYSYGAEFFFKKALGDFSGWIGYTWSKTMRNFEIISEEEFPAKFDRRHDLSVVFNYKINKRFVVGGDFVYATGNSITIPISRYFIEGQIVDIYGEKNGFRMPAYHRADISLTYYPKKYKTITNEAGEEIRQKKRFESHWVLSVYNVYNRANPYFIYFGTEGNLDEGNIQVKAYQVSLFPILPSISWNFKF